MSLRAAAPDRARRCWSGVPVAVGAHVDAIFAGLLPQRLMPAPAPDVPRQVRKALMGLWLSRHADRPVWKLPVVGNLRSRIIRRPGARLSVTGRLNLGDSPTHVGYVARGMAATIELQSGATLVCEGTVRVGDGTRILVGPGASARIGDGSYFSGDTRLVCAQEVSIGSDCAIAWDVLIMDADFHRIEGGGGQDAPVRIGDEVWVGAGARILKGVTIGDGAVIGAGAVVTRDVPTRALAVGNPAAVVREGVRWR